MATAKIGGLLRDRRLPLGSTRGTAVAAVLATLWTTLSLFVLPANVARAIGPTSPQQRVFTSQEGGYACFRAPAVVKANDSTLLAFAEARGGTCQDSDRPDVVMKRLAPNGTDWGSLVPLVKHSGDSFYHNVSPVIDKASRKIILLYTESYHYLHLITSGDDGSTWSSPQDISTAIWDEASWGPLATGQMSTGPASGIQLAHGAKAGRLVVGMTVRKSPVNGMSDLGGALIYSDNGGDTWQRGAVSLGAEPAIGAQELSLFERGDGSIFVTARNEEGDPAEKDRAVYAVSDADNQGTAFHSDFALLPDLGLPDRGIQASTLSIREKSRDGYDRALFAAPAAKDRANLTIRSSFDGGLTWQLSADGAQVWAGPAGYSDMIDLGGGKYGIIYEAGTTGYHDFIQFDTFTEADLDAPADSLNITLNQNTGALATTNPVQLHLFAPTPTGALGEWFKEPDGTVKRGIWGTTEITGKTVTFNYGDQQHVLARGTDGSLVHDFYDPARVPPLVPQTWLGAGTVAGAPTGFVDGHQQHAFVRATDGRLLHVWWDANSPSILHQTWAQPASLLGDPVSILYGEQQHVWAVGTDNQLHHWWWTPGLGVRSEAWPGAVKGTPTVFVDKGQLHVYASDMQGQLAHWWWSSTDGLKHQVLSSPTPLGGSPIAFVHGSQQHVYARTVNNTLAHWWWDPTTGNHYDVRSGLIYSDPVAGVFNNTQDVFGAAADSTLHHWWWNSTDGNNDEPWGGTIATTRTW